MTKKIAFCFLLYEHIKHNSIWENFFLEDSNCTHNIYSHIKKKSPKTHSWIERNKVNTISTKWCDESLVFAWILMLKKALKDKSNKYFILLSDQCIPLYNYTTLYNKITRSKKSRIHLNTNISLFNKKVYDFTGLYYADQWMVLNRKSSRLLIELEETELGKNWLIYAKNMLCWGSDCLPTTINKGQKYGSKKYSIRSDATNKLCLCPDEIFPINWFVFKLGTPSSKNFKKLFNITPTTFTKWDGKNPHPINFNLSDILLKKITIDEMKKTDSLFARKFSKRAAKFLLSK